MPKLKTGEKVSWKESGKRFKEGVENLTPLQRLSSEIKGTFITLIGFIVASVMIIISWNKIGLIAYGLILIFIGSVWTYLMKFLGQKQGLKSLRTTEFNSVNVEDILDKQEEKEVKKC